jgi:RNA polymerase sigma-70 factor (ECF subfamily)
LTAHATDRLDDAPLLARALEGDDDAFEEIVRRYQRRVYGVARRICRRHDVADDVTQEAFVKAFAALDRFDPTRPFGPWVVRIATNVALNHLRSPRSREDPLPDESGELRAPERSALEDVLQGEAVRAHEQALDELPVEQRAVFVLRSEEELSYKEIAAALGVSMGTVMSRLFRAREHLVAALAPRFPGLERLRSARGGPA